MANLSTGTRTAATGLVCAVVALSASRDAARAANAPRRTPRRLAARRRPSRSPRPPSRPGRWRGPAPCPRHHHHRLTRDCSPLRSSPGRPHLSRSPVAKGRLPRGSRDPRQGWRWRCATAGVGRDLCRWDNEHRRWGSAVPAHGRLVVSVRQNLPAPDPVGAVSRRRRDSSYPRQSGYERGDWSRRRFI